MARHEWEIETFPVECDTCHRLSEREARQTPGECDRPGCDGIYDWSDINPHQFADDAADEADRRYHELVDAGRRP